MTKPQVAKTSWPLTSLLQRFLQSESKAGVILIICTLISLLLANSPLAEQYLSIWHLQIGGFTVEHAVNDGLMAIFFLLVGLELEREIYIGELADIKAALLPIFAALGGMVCPALIHWLFNGGTAAQGGAGIPMATDIAFALGVLMLLGKRVPLSLKVFLTALAIIDDLGAILVIALFYSKGLAWGYLGAAIAIFALLGLLNRLRVYVLWPYLLLGAVAWYCMLHSGVHATITGVVLAFLIPFGNGDEKSPSHRLEHQLTGVVAYAILPIFALANTAIAIPSAWAQQLLSANSLGIMLGLVVGKPVGIVLFSALAVSLGWSKLPADIRWSQVMGAGMLGGIGFTMSIFITLLAFDDPALIVASKIAIMLASVMAGILGLLWLKMVSTKLPATSL